VGKHRVIALLSATAALLASGLGSAWTQEADYLRLRPRKEPTVCVTKSVKCPLVAAPRINKRFSTIPGIRNPDFGRPPVPKLQPRTRSFASPYRTFGGNRGITGGL
jgi:hypothetical protein